VTAMAARHKDASREALARLPKLDIRELREEWCRLYKADASPHLSRELLIRAVAYRMQEVALGGLRPEPQRQLRQIATELKQTGGAAKRFRPQLKPGTRLMREWQGRTSCERPSGAANRSRRHERRSHVQVQVRDGNSCLEWLPIAFPFAEGPRVRIRFPPRTAPAVGSKASDYIGWIDAYQ